MGLSTIWAAALTAAVVQQPAGPDGEAIQQRLEQALQTMVPLVKVAGRTYRSRTVAELMQSENVPGISVAVVDDGRIVWARAYGLADRATGRMATPETLFQAASISKPVAATGALALVDQGVLSLDRPVNEQLTSWQVPAHDFSETVTLRRLLSHTAGLTVHGFPGYSSEALLPTVVQVLNGAPPANTETVRVDVQPGSRWRYSGGGITVAQVLMSDATAEPFPALMDRLVLRPLGMAHSTYKQPLNEADAAAAATAHNAKGEPIAGRFHVYPEMAAAGLWTTPSDLARWAVALSSAFKGEAGGPLRPETARAMLTPGMGDWGLGVGLQGEGNDMRFWHNGVNEGFRSIFFSYPHRRQAVVIMANGETGNEVLGPVRVAIGRVLGWPGSEQRTITPVPVSRKSRFEQVGYYTHPSFSAHIGLRDDGLVLVPSQGDPVEALPQQEDVYALTERGDRMEFQRDKRSGRITSLTLGRLTLQRVR
ncbi:MAG TPA: serine hydrolase domain-containing protein [Allosphingosinicella sp.]|jgi:CubicO group peptidase (beta-lactamase class C family)